MAGRQRGGRSFEVDGLLSIPIRDGAQEAGCLELGCWVAFAVSPCVHVLRGEISDDVADALIVSEPDVLELPAQFGRDVCLQAFHVGVCVCHVTWHLSADVMKCLHSTCLHAYTQAL